MIPVEFFTMETGTSGMGGNLDPIQLSDERLFVIRAHAIDPTRPGSWWLRSRSSARWSAAAVTSSYRPSCCSSTDLSNKLVPMAMLNGELTAQGAPMFLRMFEAMNREIP